MGIAGQCRVQTHVRQAYIMGAASDESNENAAATSSTDRLEQAGHATTAPHQEAGDGSDDGRLLCAAPQIPHLGACLLGAPRAGHICRGQPRMSKAVRCVPGCLHALVRFRVTLEVSRQSASMHISTMCSLPSSKPDQVRTIESHMPALAASWPLQALAP